MGYAKLFSNITESSLWSEPKETRLLFVSMLARADATGFVEAAIPGLARISNLTLPEVQEAIKSLEGPDPHSQDLDSHPENEGRRLLKMKRGWLIVNYQDYRDKNSDEDRRKYMREYMKEYRKNGSKVNVKKCNYKLAPLTQAEVKEEADTKEKEYTDPDDKHADQMQDFKPDPLAEEDKLLENKDMFPDASQRGDDVPTSEEW